MENEIDMWFEENCFVPKQLTPTESEDEPEVVVTIELVMQFLALKKFHRRNYNYPNYAAVMKEAEKLGVGSSRLLNKEQLVLLLNKWTVQPNIQHELQLAFQVFDTENRGFLELEELDMIVSMYGERFAPTEVRELLRDANLSGNGNVDYHQFVRSMFRIAPELNDIQVEYLYSDGDEDPSVEPEIIPEEPEPPPPEPEPTPPPSPKKEAKKEAKKKK